MGWKTVEKEKPQQTALFTGLTSDEERVVELLRASGELFIDQISAGLKLPGSRVSGMLLNLEFKNVLVALPGKMYRLK